MKNLLVLILLLQSSLLFAQERKTVVLLTSVTHKRINIENKLENIFRRKLRGYPFNLKVIHKADQAKLHQELISEENQAIFWVSHGAFVKLNRNASKASLAPVNMILDYRRDNVAPIFQKINPGLEFIGIVGCNSKQILTSYRENSIWSAQEDTPPAEYVSKTKAVAQFALKRSLRRFKKAWKYRKLPKEELTLKTKGHPVTVSLQMPLDTPEEELRSIRIMHKGQFIGLIEKPFPGQKISKRILIPEQKEFKNSSFNLLLTTGESVYKEPREIHFGAITVRDEMGNSWKVFSKPSGEAFGVNQRILLYRGSSNILNSLVEVNSF